MLSNNMEFLFTFICLILLFIAWCIIGYYRKTRTPNKSGQVTIDKTLSEKKHHETDIEELVYELKEYQQEITKEYESGIVEDDEITDKIAGATKLIKETGIDDAILFEIFESFDVYQGDDNFDDIDLGFKGTEISRSFCDDEEMGFEEEFWGAFTFEGSKYRLEISADHRHSHEYDSSGEARFYCDGQLVLAMSTTYELNTNAQNFFWKLDAVHVLKPGKWMKAVLKISNQIERD
jgi:hypothetical protein